MAVKFIIRLLNDEDALHLNAVAYFKYFLENEIALKISTIKRNIKKISFLARKEI